MPPRPEEEATNNSIPDGNKSGEEKEQRAPPMHLQFGKANSIGQTLEDSNSQKLPMLKKAMLIMREDMPMIKETIAMII